MTMKKESDALTVSTSMDERDAIIAIKNMIDQLSKLDNVVPSDKFFGWKYGEARNNWIHATQKLKDVVQEGFKLTQ
jgi:hypothetical protein